MNAARMSAIAASSEALKLVRSARRVVFEIVEADECMVVNNGETGRRALPIKTFQ